MLNPDYTLNQTKYNEQGPFYITDFFTISYFCSFVNIATVVSHVALWHGEEIIKQLKDVVSQKKLGEGLKDTHNRLNSVYPDIAEASYGIYMLVLSFATILVCQFTPFYLPWWASILAILMGALLTVPIGLVQAVTGRS
jgi:hypothetical protein